MSFLVRSETDTKNTLVNVYGGIDQTVLSQKVDQVFAANKYKKKEDAVGNQVYQRGSRFWRIMIGAFHKYFKYTVSYNNNAEGIKITVVNETSGMSGGMIGMNQVSKEFKKIKANLNNL